MTELLTTKQLAEYLQLSERSVYRLLERGEIPALKVGGQWRFRRSAVDEWLGARFSGMGPHDLEVAGPAAADPPGVAELLSADNIFLDVPAGSKTEVLGALVERLVLPEEVDRPLLLARLLEREGLCSTTLADGVAVPHTPRTRDRVLRDHDLVAIARTCEPVDFGALDGDPTRVLVLVLARDERAHLVLLAKVSRLVRDPTVQEALRAGDAERIMSVLRAAERALFD